MREKYIIIYQKRERRKIRWNNGPHKREGIHSRAQKKKGKTFTINVKRRKMGAYKNTFFCYTNLNRTKNESKIKKRREDTPLIITTTTYYSIIIINDDNHKYTYKKKCEERENC